MAQQDQEPAAKQGLAPAAEADAKASASAAPSGEERDEDIFAEIAETSPPAAEAENGDAPASDPTRPDQAAASASGPDGDPSEAAVDEEPPLATAEEHRAITDESAGADEAPETETGPDAEFDVEPQTPETPVAASPAKPPVAPPPRRRSFLGSLMFFLALLLLAAVGGGLAAIQFKDKDARLRVVADFLQSAAKDPDAAFRALQEKTVALVSGEEPAKKIAGPLPAPAKSNPTTPAPAKPAAPEQPARRESPAPMKADTPARAPAASLAPSPPPSPAPSPALAPVAPTPAPAAVHSADAGERDKELKALAGRVADLEAIARAAREAAVEARATADEARAAAARAAEASEKAGAAPAPPEDTPSNAFLLGRIDEIAEELKALRERFDSPKSETRATPEASEVRGGEKAGGAADVVVLAQSLIHELDRGRPYASELAALAALGADPQLLAALAPSAETGAPTAAQLARDFIPLARRLRALEAPKADAPIADQLLAGASKLIKVRPTGEPSAESASDIVGKIETALSHDDVAAAAEGFARLSDPARAEAKSFGEALQRRRDAEKAADTLLSSAIAALGQRKN